MIHVNYFNAAKTFQNLCSIKFTALHFIIHVNHINASHGSNELNLELCKQGDIVDTFTLLTHEHKCLENAYQMLTAKYLCNARASSTRFWVNRCHCCRYVFLRGTDIQGYDQFFCHIYSLSLVIFVFILCYNLPKDHVEKLERQKDWRTFWEKGFPVIHHDFLIK